MLNHRPDIDHLATTLATNGRVQVPAVLSPEFAEQIETCLLQDVPWRLAIRTDEQTGSRTLEYGDMNGPQLDALIQQAHEGADDGFYFAYDSYMMIRAYLSGWNPGLLLHKVTELFNSENFLYFAHRLTGDTSINKVDAQATRYRQGHFLSKHDDRDDTQGRRYAYVLSLSRQWKSEWGGLLRFYDESKKSGQIVPAFNVLNVFRVPQLHDVSMVKAEAQQHRLSITGWFLNS